MTVGSDVSNVVVDIRTGTRTVSTTVLDCSSYTCEVGWERKKNSQQIVCNAGPCDRDTCCAKSFDDSEPDETDFGVLD